MEFGNKIQMLRKNRNISQETLASILKINRNYLSRIETGKSEPTLSIIRDIAIYFGVEVTSLIGIERKTGSSEEKIKKITEECHYLIDEDLEFLERIISIMRSEYVKKV